MAMMKKSVLFTCAGVLTAGLSSSAFADPAGSAMSHVFVNVDPNIAVMARTGNVDLGTVQLGKFAGNSIFRVDANEEAVMLGVATTDLYKGDDPTNTDVKPLPVDLSQGALIEPTNANPLGGASNVAQYDSAGTSISTPFGDMNGYRTNDITFESSQNGHFSQDVSVTVGWQQPDPEQPKGEYSGYVVLYTALVGGTPIPAATAQ
jgi:hypothetical protein